MEEWVNVIVFHFRRGNDLLANCVDLEHILLHTINSELLSFILLFTNPSGSALKPFSFPRYGRTPVSMEGLLYEIVTDMKINNSLTMKNKQLRAKLKKVRKLKPCTPSRDSRTTKKRPKLTKGPSAIKTKTSC